MNRLLAHGLARLHCTRCWRPRWCCQRSICTRCMKVPLGSGSAPGRRSALPWFPPLHRCRCRVHRSTRILFWQRKRRAPLPLFQEKQAATVPDDTAIPIPAKPQHIKKIAPKAAPAPPKYAQPKPQQYRANYGEAAPSSIPTSIPTAADKSVVIQNGDFGSRFGWYVDVIKLDRSRKTGIASLPDPKASMGHSAIVTFTVHRDGSVSDPGSRNQAACLRSIYRRFKLWNASMPSALYPMDIRAVRFPSPIPLRTTKVHVRNFF